MTHSQGSSDGTGGLQLSRSLTWLSDAPLYMPIYQNSAPVVLDNILPVLGCGHAQRRGLHSDQRHTIIIDVGINWVRSIASDIKHGPTLRLNDIRSQLSFCDFNLRYVFMTFSCIQG